MPSPFCYQHPAHGGVATCTQCLQFICRACLWFNGSLEFCGPCHERAQHAARKRKALISIAVGLGAMTIAVFAAWLMMRPAPVEAALTTTAAAVGEPEPCDRARIVRQGEALLRLGDNRKAIEKSEAFFKRCGEYPRLLWVTYSAHKHLSEFKQAVDAASKLIESDPDDKDYWWWRGIAYEGLEKWEDAAADYESALKVQPALKNIPFNLSRAYERQGKPCQALAAVERYVTVYPEAASRPEVKHRIERLRAEGHCGEAAREARVLPAKR